jgi:hypothetical protein
MDVLALSNALNNLDQSWSALDWWSNFWTFLVVLGVLVELLVLSREYWDDLFDFWTGIIVPPHKPSTSLFLLGLLGAGLVAIGVAGEFWIHIKAGKVETEMRDLTKKLVAAASDRASNAEGSASEAILEAGHANERASKNEVDAAQLRKDAEDERLKRVEIEERVEWRRLTKDQQRKIGAALQGFSGEIVSLGYNVHDVEAFLFASDIAAALHSASWKVSGPGGAFMFGGSPITGVNIETTGDTLSRSSGLMLQQALSGLGFDSQLSLTGGPQSPPRNMVFVESRPEGSQGEAKLREQQEAKSKQHKNK